MSFPAAAQKEGRELPSSFLENGKELPSFPATSQEEGRELPSSFPGEGELPGCFPGGGEGASQQLPKRKGQRLAGAAKAQILGRDQKVQYFKQTQ